MRALRTELGTTPLVVAAASAELLEDLPEDEIAGIQLSSRKAPVFEQLTQALLEAVSKQKLSPNATVVALYSGFEDGIIDSLSVIRLDEHLGQLTVRDLRKIETRIPFETLKLVVDLAVDIGREGREGKPVGTMFVIGDHRKTLKYCRPMGFDPVRGYKPAERSLFDVKVREGVKEIAQMDGAFIVSDSGVVMASASMSRRRPPWTSASRRVSAPATGPPPKSPAPPPPLPWRSAVPAAPSASSKGAR